MPGGCAWIAGSNPLIQIACGWVKLRFLNIIMFTLCFIRLKHLLGSLYFCMENKVNFSKIFSNIFWLDRSIYKHRLSALLISILSNIFYPKHFRTLSLSLSIYLKSYSTFIVYLSAAWKQCFPCTRALFNVSNIERISMSNKLQRPSNTNNSAQKRKLQVLALISMSD